MIYITPKKFLLSERNNQLAKHFAKKELLQGQGVDEFIQKINDAVEVVHANKDMLRAQINYPILQGQYALAQANILTKAFANTLQSCKMTITMGFKCPPSIKLDFERRKEGSHNLRLKLAIEAYNKAHSTDFKLNPNHSNDLRFVSYMQRPVHSNRIANLDSQKARLRDQLQIYVKHKITETIQELKMTLENENKKEIGNRQSSRINQNILSDSLCF